MDLPNSWCSWELSVSYTQPGLSHCPKNDFWLNKNSSLAGISLRWTSGLRKTHGLQDINLMFSNDQYVPNIPLLSLEMGSYKKVYPILPLGTFSYSRLICSSWCALASRFYAPRQRMPGWSCTSTMLSWLLMTLEPSECGLGTENPISRHIFGEGATFL